MQFVPIHNHSEYSALDGLSTCKEIAARCVELGCPCCGLTDHGTVAGHLDFARELTAVGIKPIFGAELYHGIKPRGNKAWTRNERDAAHLVVGARTNEGLKNLWRLVDAGSTNFRYVPRVTWDDLKSHTEGLFATSSCMMGLIPQGLKQSDYTALNQYVELFGDNFYIELHTYPGDEQEAINLALVQIAQERGLPLVYANDAHYATPAQYSAHDAYFCMQTGQNIDEPLEDRKMWHPLALYIMDEPDIRDFLHYLPESVVDEALDNTVELAERCDVTLPEVKRHLPVFIPGNCPYVKDKEISAASLFLDLVEEGLRARYGVPKQEVWDRATKEMEVFLDNGLHHYFLQAWDFCEFCDAKGIVRGPGRGSAAGSLVAYALGITDVDPLRYDLIFERFFNPGRAKGFPDIDNDFPQGDRKAVIAYLQRRWGADKVRHIGTVTRMKPKAALDKTYKAMSITWAEKEEVKKIVSTVPDLEILTSDSIGWEDDGGGKKIYVIDHVGQDIEKWILTQPQSRERILRRWLDFVRVVCSRVSGYGVHASGVVVSDVPLDEELPSMWSATKECQATVFSMSDVEKRQFVKQDILGLRTLDTLQDWQRQIKANTGIDIEWSGLEAKDHPIEMWEMLDKGLATGIFQIEDKPYVRQLAIDFKPRSVEDLSIIVALNRPGPIRSGAPASFVRRRNGEEPVSYDHPILEDILEPTYGWFLYQEQVIKFFEKIGYSSEDADAVRKILGKKLPEEMKALYKGEGEWDGKGYAAVAGPALHNYRAPMTAGTTYNAVQHRSDQASEVIWKKLEEFALYSFNKSHSIAYATIAFRTLYAKYYAPAEFIIACIRTNPDDASLYVSEGRRLGISVLPPDIRQSEEDVVVKDDKIYFGFSNVKGIGKNTAKYITQMAKDYDVYSRADLENALLTETAKWEQARDAHKATGDPYPYNLKVKSPKSQLKANVIDNLERIGVFDNYVERIVTQSDMQRAEKELLGIILTDNNPHIFQANQDLIADCDSYPEFAELESDSYADLPGTIVAIRPTKTKAAQKDMGIVKIEWGSETVEFVVFPQQWIAYKFLWKERTPGIFRLKKTDKGVNFERGQKLSG